MAPCHHGNGATGLPCRGDRHVRSPTERSTGQAGHRAPGTSPTPPAATSPAPFGHATEPISCSCITHGSRMPPQQDVTPAGCHPGRLSPRHDAAPAGQLCTAAAGCSAPGTRGWSRLFPEQPSDDAHRQGYNLAKHSAGALEGAGPRQLIIQSRTHRAHACHSNEGVCVCVRTGLVGVHAALHQRSTHVAQGRGRCIPARIPWDPGRELGGQHGHAGLGQAQRSPVPVFPCFLLAWNS